MALKTISTLDELVGVVERLSAEGHRVFVRYSRGPAADRKSGYASRNHATGRQEAGLSCEQLTPEAWYCCNGRTARDWIAMQVRSYGFMLAQGGRGTYAWVLTGREVGRGSDNEPLVADVAPVARLALAVVNEAVAHDKARHGR